MKPFRVIKKAIVNEEHWARVRQQADQKQKGGQGPPLFFKTVSLSLHRVPGQSKGLHPGLQNYFFFDFLAFFAFFAFFAFLAIASSFELMD